MIERITGPGATLRHVGSSALAEISARGATTVGRQAEVGTSNGDLG